MSAYHTLPYDNCFHSLSYEGFPVHFKEYSKGLTEIPLVFIGGAFQNITAIEKLSKAFAEKTWVIAVDTPGNGDTGVLPHDYNFEFICRAIHHGLTQLGVEKLNMLGCSYGSIVAMRYAQQFSTGVEKLMLASAMEQLPKQLEYDFNLLLLQLEWGRMDEFADGFTDLMTNPILRESNRICRVASEKLRHALKKSTTGIQEQFKHNTLRILNDGKTNLALQPDVEATIFTGEHDHFVPVPANVRVAQSFKRGRFISVPDADHMIHIEKFKRMVEIVLTTVEGTITPDAPAFPTKPAPDAEKIASITGNNSLAGEAMPSLEKKFPVQKAMFSVQETMYGRAA